MCLAVAAFAPSLYLGDKRQIQRWEFKAEDRGPELGKERKSEERCKIR